jgi:hypothetical protein
MSVLIVCLLDIVTCVASMPPQFEHESERQPDRWAESLFCCRRLWRTLMEAVVVWKQPSSVLTDRRSRVGIKDRLMHERKGDNSIHASKLVLKTVPKQFLGICPEDPRPVSIRHKRRGLNAEQRWRVRKKRRIWIVCAKHQLTRWNTICEQSRDLMEVRWSSRIPVESCLQRRQCPIVDGRE